MGHEKKNDDLMETLMRRSKTSYESPTARDQVERLIRDRRAQGWDLIDQLLFLMEKQVKLARMEELMWLADMPRTGWRAEIARRIAELEHDETPH